jgi:hypothetical protein
MDLVWCLVESLAQPLTRFFGSTLTDDFHDLGS